MTKRETELARRAIAAKGWKWLPGMLESKGLRILRVAPDGYAFAWNQTYHHGWTLGSEALPDLGDAATRGCLLELVRMAWRNATLHARPDGDGWCVWSANMPGAFLFDSEAEALIAALEAAP